MNFSWKLWVLRTVLGLGVTAVTVWGVSYWVATQTTRGLETAITGAQTQVAAQNQSISDLNGHIGELLKDIGNDKADFAAQIAAEVVKLQNQQKQTEDLALSIAELNKLLQANTIQLASLNATLQQNTENVKSLRDEFVSAKKDQSEFQRIVISYMMGQGPRPQLTPQSLKGWGLNVDDETFRAININSEEFGAFVKKFGLTKVPE